MGGHNEKANVEIVKIILEKLGKLESLITYVADRYGHDQRCTIDSAKTMGEFRWTPTNHYVQRRYCFDD